MLELGGGHAEDALDAVGIADGDLHVRLRVKAGAGIDGAALDEDAAERVERDAVFSENGVKALDDGTIELLRLVVFSGIDFPEASIVLLRLSCAVTDMVMEPCVVRSRQSPRSTTAPTTAGVLMDVFLRLEDSMAKSKPRCGLASQK